MQEYNNIKELQELIDSVDYEIISKLIKRKKIGFCIKMEEIAIILPILIRSKLR